MRVLLLNFGTECREAANNALAGEGYDVAIDRGLNVDQLLALAPEVLVTEATPSDLSCCELIAQLKARPRADSSLKIVLIVHGGALERAHGLDLGVDDVISFPFEKLEFAARIRTQFREQRPQEELKIMLKHAMLREFFADVVVESLSGLLGKRPLWLIPAIFLFSALFAAVYLGISNRGTGKETRQLRADVTRLTNSLGQQSELLRRAELARGLLEVQPRAAATADSPQAQPEDIRNRLDSDADSLKRQLGDAQNRLKLLERESKIAETVVRNYGSSVCLLDVVVEFLDQQSGRPIQIAVDAAGKPLVDDKNMMDLVTHGAGPPLRIDVFGTGFVVRRDGKIITNHHIVEPWWKNEELRQLLDNGAAPYVSSYEIYLPGQIEGLRAKLDRISSQADLATLQLESPLPRNSAVLEFDDRTDAAVTGDPVVLIGYPTGIEGILARAGTDAARKIDGGPRDVDHVMSLIASQHLIRPTTTQGHIGDVLADKIVYDAATTSGGSGGPLFNRSGKVIAINFAVLRDFGGSNLAVPAKYAKDLLK